MADKPDLNKLKDKFDFAGIIDSVKSMISPAGGTPDVDPDDSLGLKIAEVSVLLQEMAQHQQEHVKNLAKVNELLNGVFADLQAIRKGGGEEGADQEKTEQQEAAPAVKEDKAQAPKVAADKKTVDENAEPAAASSEKSE